MKTGINKGFKHDFHLERLWWRYCHGWYDENRVTAELEYESDRLAAMSFQLGDHIDFLRRFRQEELILIDELQGEIIRHTGRKEFRDAVDKIKESQRILMELQETAAAAGPYESVLHSVNELVALVGEKWLAETQTYKIIDRLHQETKSYITNKQIKNARLNLLVCQSEVLRLLKLYRDAKRKKQLEQRLEKVSGIVSQVKDIPGLELNKKKLKSRIKTIRTLMKSDYLELAERLLEELEMEHGARFFYCSEYLKIPEEQREEVLKKIEEPGSRAVEKAADDPPGEQTKRRKRKKKKSLAAGPPLSGTQQIDRAARLLLEERIKSSGVLAQDMEKKLATCIEPLPG